MIIDVVGATKVQVSDEVKKVANFGIRIEDTPFIFQLLRKNIYSDPILAVIREYTTNAYDAHKDAGIESTPIKVTLPSYNNLVFKVRDFGKGISPENIAGIFCNYGASTKRTSNDFTGALGIGAKSALAINDSFVVTSIYDKIKTIYNCTLDETGNGRIDKMAQSETSEPSGVEIYVGVKYSDYYSFALKAKELFAYFKTIPIIEGQDIEITKPIFWQQGIDWGINLHTGKPVLVMGNIPYPINNDKVFGEFNWLLNAGVTIFAEIGTVDFASSREQLAYTEKTNNFILSKLQKISDELYATMQAKINTCTNLNEVARFVGDLDKRSEKIVKGMCRELTWNGFNISSRFEFVTTNSYEFFTITDRGRRENMSYSFKINLNQNVKFILIPQNVHIATTRIKYYKEVNKPEALIIVSGDIEEFKKNYLLDEDCLVLGATLPKRPNYNNRDNSNIKRQYNNKYSKKVLVLADSTNLEKNSDNWRVPTEEDFESEQKIYVKINRFQPENTSFLILNCVVDAWLHLYGEKLTLFSIKENNNIDLTTDGWVEFNTWLNQQKELLKEDVIFKEIAEKFNFYYNFHKESDPYIFLIKNIDINKLPQTIKNDINSLKEILQYKFPTNWFYFQDLITCVYSYKQNIYKDIYYKLVASYPYFRAITKADDISKEEYGKILLTLFEKVTN